MIFFRCVFFFLCLFFSFFNVGSTPSVEPNVRFELTTLRSRPELRSRVRATQVPPYIFFFFFKLNHMIRRFFYNFQWFSQISGSSPWVYNKIRYGFFCFVFCFVLLLKQIWVFVLIPVHEFCPPPAESEFHGVQTF